MVELAQALVIGRTDKQVPVSTEGDDMVHHRSGGAPPLAAQTRQKGSRSSCAGRSSWVQTTLEYQL
ncbi:MAG: hypothetical protein ACLR1T_09100 [Evtepia gabavorous]